MKLIRLPSEFDASYTPARGPALLLSCMDLRFMDEIIMFMDHDGLTNRYDHVTLAGSALGALGGDAKYGPPDKKTKTPATFPCLTGSFFAHLDWAYQLHHIKDVYVIEHRDCGAYGLMLQAEGKFPPAPPADPAADREADVHGRYAGRLQKLIVQWVAHKKAEDAAKYKDLDLGFHSFLMGLRGEVSVLPPVDDEPPSPAPTWGSCSPTATTPEIAVIPPVKRKVKA